ncbi:MAG: hypothetical protein IKS41_06640 [Alphaproteobacteria bacterium]|nr:hypothetical protein [Alphaproteobacteria bacterium]
MKKSFLIFLPLMLSGCFSPNFHEKTQSIYFEKSPEMSLTLENYGDVVSPEIIVNREFGSLKGTLFKKGFQSKEIEIKSHWTDDKWAQHSVKKRNSKESVFEEYSAWRALPPTQTIVMPIEGAIGGAKLPFELSGDDDSPWCYIFAPFTSAYFAVGGLVTGIIYDSLDLITLSWPRAVLGNPWYEYDKYIDLSKEILTPTPEFEQKCHNQKNKFIGNNSCLSCKTKDNVISTQDECNRCPNREWVNSECILKP